MRVQPTSMLPRCGATTEKLSKSAWQRPCAGRSACSAPIRASALVAAASLPLSCNLLSSAEEMRADCRGLYVLFISAGDVNRNAIFEKLHCPMCRAICSDSGTLWSFSCAADSYTTLMAFLLSVLYSPLSPAVPIASALLPSTAPPT